MTVVPYSYVAPSDFRLGSGKWYTAGLTLIEEDADENALSDAITAKCQAFDLYTDDHFEPEPGDGPPETEITIDLSGTGGPNLYVPKRIRSISDVSLRDRDGVLTTQDAAVYRITASLMAGIRTEDDLDMVSIVPGRFLNGTGWWDDWSYLGNWTDWPVGVDNVQLTGTFSWPETPEDVKRAVALMVYDAIKPSAPGIHSATEWSTQVARFVSDPNSLTGLDEVDRIIKRFTRQRIPTI